MFLYGRKSADDERRAGKQYQGDEDVIAFGKDRRGMLTRLNSACGASGTNYYIGVCYVMSVGATIFNWLAAITPSHCNPLVQNALVPFVC